MIRRSSHQYAKSPVLAFVAGFVAITAMPALATGTFQKTGSMNVARISHTATLLLNGDVLVAGGDNSSLGDGYLASAEFYNPSTGSWTLTGTMTTARQRHQAVLLPSGEVLVAGGENASGTLASAELYNPSTGVWTPTGSPTSGVGGPNAALLLDGRVLAIEQSNSTPSELYDPSTGTWSATYCGHYYY